MPILDVTRNRHLEIIGQEIRVNHDFLPHFCLLRSYTYGLRFQVTKVYIHCMYRNKKQVKPSALKTVSPRQCQLHNDNK